MNVHEYLNLTEHAVRYFYAGLDDCWQVYERALEHWDLSRVGKPLTEEEMERARKYVEQAGKYFSLKFSEGTLAGAIFQVATTGIRLFSANNIIPDDCIDIVSPKAKSAIPFCIGKRLYGLPLGLIIYAARNQYAHFEEDPHQVTSNVFHQLTIAFWDNPLYDLAFDLGNPTIDIYANEILLGGLNWTTYEKFRSEMEELLNLDGNY
jgi:hypothetical protein